MSNQSPERAPGRLNRPLRRGASLVVLGLAVNAYNSLVSGDPVISPNGTLQQIGIVYGLAGSSALYRPHPFERAVST